MTIVYGLIASWVIIGIIGAHLLRLRVNGMFKKHYGVSVVDVDILIMNRKKNKDFTKFKPAVITGTLIGSTVVGAILGVMALSAYGNVSFIRKEVDEVAESVGLSKIKE